MSKESHAEAWARAGNEGLSEVDAMALADVSHAVRSVLAQNSSVPRSVLDHIYRGYPELALDVCLNINASPRMKLSVPVHLHSHAAIQQCLSELGCSDEEVKRFWEVASAESHAPLREVVTTAGIRVDGL